MLYDGFLYIFVRFYFKKILITYFKFVNIYGHEGVLAQLGERFLHTEEVAGSIPVDSTINSCADLAPTVERPTCNR